jgi:ATP-binding cassette, subfamily B, bacterial
MTETNKKEPRLPLKRVANNFWYSVKESRRLGKKYMFVKYVYALINGFIPLSQAYLAGRIINELSKVASGTASRPSLIIYVLLSSVLGTIYFSLGTYVDAYLKIKGDFVQTQVDEMFLRRITSLKMEYYDTPKIRDGIERAKDGSREVLWQADSASRLLSDLIKLFGSVGIILSSTWLIGLATIPLPFIIIYLRTQDNLKRRKIWESSREVRMRKYRSEDLFSSPVGMMEMRLYGVVQKMLSLWRRSADELTQAEYVNSVQSRRSSTIIEVVETLAGVFVDIWLALQVFARVIPLGVFEQNRRLVSAYINSMSSIGGTFAGTIGDSFRVNDYRKFFEGKEFEQYFREDKPGDKVLDTPKLIKIDDVSFTYPNQPKPVLQDVNLELPTNQHIALVGENGAGKTTLLKIMLGLFYTRGVTYDGVEVGDISEQSLEPLVSPLMQDYHNYDFMSVADSVAVGAPGKVDKKRLVEVLKLVGLYDYFMSQPKKLESQFGWAYDDSVKMSGGQWQRLAIARALYKNAPILVLDEPTSAIDAKSEQDIIDHIFEAYKNRMVIIVSHRLSTVSRADRIVMLKDGCIVEDGTHKALFKPGTAYHDLFGRQGRAHADSSE